MKNWYLAGSLMVIIGSIVGCGRTDDPDTKAANGTGDAHADHEGHPAPENLPDAIAKIKEARTELGEAYVAGNASEADHAFHELRDTLKATKELIASSSMERYDSQDAQAACDRVMEVVGELHPPHGADAKLDAGVYDKVKADLDDAISKLETAVNKGIEENATAE
jgi:hypothetical protein